MRANTIDLGGPVHLAEWGRGAPSFVLVHGLGGSHLNWMMVAPALSRRGRVLAPDLAGFGLTPVAGRRTTVAAQRALVHRLLLKLAPRPVVLVGNSMGGLVTLAEAGLHPELVSGLVMVDAALPVPWREPPDRVVTSAFAAYALPAMGRRALRRLYGRHQVEEIVAGAFAFCAVDPGRIPGSVVEAHVRLEEARMTRRGENNRAFVDAGRSIVMAHLARAPVDRLIRRVAVPTLVIHGAGDRLVNVRAARRAGQLRPDWTVRIVEDAGHIPMLEVPDLFLSTVESWLDAHGLAPVMATERSPAEAQRAATS
ncbi:MAG TPA: alpha/beta hydrolase [Candidatus Binatia bacterium]|nr:alpha/beta hydrolase [Candidatus Binatia bacterium]